MPGPSASAHQVLVYSGPGVSPLSLSHTLLTLSLLLLPHYTVQPITPITLSSEPWEQACALLVIPGGRDLPFVEELSVKTRVTKRIREFVEHGGKFLGICAGAYFGTESVEFDKGGEMEVLGKRDLALIPGVCAGPSYPGFHYASEKGSRAISLVLSRSSRSLDHLYYNGGGHFILPSPIPPGVEVLATYGDNGHVAAVTSAIGSGRAVLTGVHFEYPLHDPPARDAIAKLPHPPTSEEIDQSEKDRIGWTADLLRLLGLTPPTQHDDGAIRPKEPAEEDPELLLHPTHPSPIFVFSHPDLPQLGNASFQASALASKMVEEGGKTILRDGNDEFQIAAIDSIAEEGGESDIAAYLSHRRHAKPTIPPQIQNLSLEGESAAHPPPVPDLNAIPKTILLPSENLAYSARWTPLFNFGTYWTELDAARKRVGKKSGGVRDGKSSLGDLVWYAEAITSTQTILDRNPLLLSHLPTPLVCTASFQLSGRGRGSNIWLSPPGCLQYSILLSLPSSMSSKIVFIQYLAALSICEAVDEDGRLGVRIKWPNDLYAEVEGVGGTEIGGGVKGKAKLGGILVNTNYINGQWRIVVGCGVNVLNALPTTSLSQLHSLLAARNATPSKPLPPAPTMEGTFAKIMTAFEQKWDQFIDDKGFAGFLDEYYARWLHSNSEVTLTTVTPHQRLRIHSITPDHGLLRCVPLEQPRGPVGLTPLYMRGDYGDDDRVLSKRTDGEKYVDLQPDGNSFDLMAGLIKRKT